MRKILVPIVALLALAGCGSASPYAVRVNDTTVTQAEIDEEMQAILDSPKYLEFVKTQQEQAGLSVEGKGKRTLSSAYVSQLLNVRIVSELISEELRRLKIKATPADRREARSSYEQQLGADVFGDLPKSYQDYLVERVVESRLFSTAVADKVTDAEIEKFYKDNEDRFQTTCVSHILVDTQAEAVDVKQRLAAGEDFAELARTRSKDNGGGTGGSAVQGGSLGCLGEEEASGFVEEFKVALDALQPGETSEPVKTQFGYHVIRVTEKKLASLEEARGEIQQQLADPDERLQALIRDAKIDLNPRYGSFVTEPQLRGVVPNDAPATSTTVESPLIPPGG